LVARIAWHEAADAMHLVRRLLLATLALAVVALAFA